MVKPVIDNVAEVLPLSPVQGGILLNCIAENAPRSLYVGVVRCDLTGPLDPARLRACLADVVASHDAYRACFVWKGLSRPVQPVHKHVALPWQELDWTDGDAEALTQACIQSEREAGFDLTKAPLMRVVLAKLGDARYRLIWVVHHIVSDGWSTGQVLQELMQRYAGKDIEPAVSFRSYLGWMMGRDKAAEHAFWRAYLGDLEEPSELNIVAPVGVETGHAACFGTLDAPTSAKIVDLCRQARTTTSVFLSTVFGVLLNRYTGHSDIVFGETNAGRPEDIPGIERGVGAFVNTLPVRARIDLDASFETLLAQMTQDSAVRRPHLNASLGDVVRSVPNAGGELFDALFVMESFPQFDASGSGLVLSNLTSIGPSHYPFALMALPGREIALEVNFDPQKMSGDVAQAMLWDFEALVQAAAAAPTKPLADLCVQAWGAATIPTRAPGAATILTDILAASAARPDGIAVRSGDVALTYGQLEARSKALALRLGAEGLGEGDLVPIMLPRGTDAVIAMIGILRAGAAYVPMDLEYPAEHVARLLEQVAPKAIVGHAPGFEGLSLELDQPDTSGDLPQISGDMAAYVIFTSGSTGTPKGAVINHANLAYSTQSRGSVYDAPPERFLLMSSFAFDSSVVGLYWTLAQGGELVIAPTRIEQDMDAFATLITSRSITDLLCLPSLYAAMLDHIPAASLASLDRVIVAGEACRDALIDAHFDVLDGVRLYNEYGPTEATVWCAAQELTVGAAAAIGTPPDGTRLWIGDGQDAALPAGVVGQICVSGPGVIDGYLNNSDATRAAFADGVYRTGDLGFVDAQGLIHFVGRKDAQVKIRGHRVELGAVEAALRSAADGSEVAVVVLGDGADKRLFGFVVAEDTAEIATRMGANVPPAMIPSVLQAVDQLPQLPNGKIDRKALTALALASRADGSAAQALSFTEQRLAEIWSAALGVTTIHKDDDFFALGGDSLKSISVMAKAQKAGLAFDPVDLFDNPVLSDLAHRIHHRAAERVDRAAQYFVYRDGTANKRPFFMLHGSAEMKAYLASALGQDRGFGFLFSHYASADEQKKITLSQMVDDAYARIREAQGDGPYTLGGYSLGGVLAVEVAARLQSEGHEVAELFLLDPTYRVRHPVGCGHDQSANALDAVMEQAKNRVLRGATRLARDAGLRAEQDAHLAIVGRSYRIALSTHRPSVYSGPGHLFVTQESADRLGTDSWIDCAAPHLDRTLVPYGHMEQQKNPDALVSWTSRLAEILNGLDGG